MSYLGIDVGTSQAKGVLFSSDFKELASRDIAYEWKSPAAGRNEIEPEKITGAVREIIKYCSRKGSKDPVSAIAFSVFGGGICAIDKNNKPLLNIIGTTDSRAARQADFWAEKFGRERAYEITGVVSHSSLMLPKAMWIKEEFDGAGIDRFVTASEIVAVSLGIEPMMDYSAASTTMLFDAAKKDWCDEIINFAGIGRKMLPRLIPSGGIMGEIPGGICRRLGLRPGCKVVAGGHDQQVCAFGAGVAGAGESACSMGTVECITALFDKPRINGDLLRNNFSNLTHVDNKRFVMLAYNFSSGALLKWCREKLFNRAASFERIFGKITARPSDIFVLPHFSGSGTPYLDSGSRGVIMGLTLHTDAGDILRGVIDSQNYEMRLNLDIWRRNGIRIDTLKAYGKGSSTDALLRIKSDILNVRIEKLNMTETGCFGAALLAAKGSEPALDIEKIIRKKVKVKKTFVPGETYRDEYERKFSIYREIYPAVKGINRTI